MKRWEPHVFSADPIANALHNIAHELNRCAQAIEIAGTKIGGGLQEGTTSSVANALEGISSNLEKLKVGF